MLKRFFALGAAVLTTLVSACEDGPRTQSGGWRSAAVWSSMVYASANGPIFLEVHGEPFAPMALSAMDVAMGMSDKLVGRKLAFTPVRASALRPEFKVVLAFNPPANADPRDLCEGAIATAAQPGEQITVLAVFCDKSGILSSVQGWVSKVSGPDDPRFRRLLGQVTRDLIGSAP